MTDLIFFGFYALAALVIVLHFAGVLEEQGLEWLVFVLAAAVFPVMIFTA